MSYDANLDSDARDEPYRPTENVPVLEMGVLVDHRTGWPESRLDDLSRRPVLSRLHVSLVDCTGHLDPVTLPPEASWVAQLTSVDGAPSALAEAVSLVLDSTLATFVMFTGPDLLSQKKIKKAIARGRSLAKRGGLLDAPFPLLVAIDWSETAVTGAYIDWVHTHHRGYAEANRQALDAYVHLNQLRDPAARLDGIDVVGDGTILRLTGHCRRGGTDGDAPPSHELRLVVIDSSGASSAPVIATPTLRIQAAEPRWTGFVAELMISELSTGASTFDVELDRPGNEPVLRVPVTISTGMLSSSRTITAHERRFQVFPVHGSERAEIVLQRAGSRLSHWRWRFTVGRRDVGALVHRRPFAWVRLARILTRPLFVRPIWLIGERPDTARDNGYHLFKHLNAEHPDIRVYYVLERASDRFEELSRLGRVVVHSSWRHRLMMLHVKALLNAYAIPHMLPRQWDLGDYIRHCAWRVGSYRIYLKHGVDKDPNVVRRQNSGFDLLLTATTAETAASRATSGYDRQITLTGLPRYDALVPTSSSRTILFMPTWRMYLTPKLFSDQTEAPVPFEGSTYQRFVHDLVNSPRLHALLDRHDYRFELLPHYNMRSHLPQLDTTASGVTVLDANISGIQDVMRRCDLFITDHSSVNFDLAYLGTPVIYAHFDDDEYYDGHSLPSWFEHERDGFGPVSYDVETTLDAVEHYLINDCRREELYERRAREAFVFHDQNNSHRVVEAVENLLRTQGLH